MSTKIQDVARTAGVSIATVSRVLAGTTVGEGLRERVLAAVEATGYRPNLAARRLRSQRAHTIGLIVSDIRSAFFTHVARAVEDAAYTAGMRVILCNTDEDPQKEAMYLRLMQEERVTGVILAATRETAATIDAARLGFPVVLIDRSGPSGANDTVVLDNFGAAMLLTEHLLARGYTRIGGLFASTSSTGVERHAGYVAALAARQLPGDARFVVPTLDDAQAEVARWLAQADRPRALVATSGQMLLGALHAARAAGLSVPGDLALAGFDNDPWVGLVDAGLAVIEQPVYEIGRAAMTMLQERLTDPQRMPRKLVLPGRLVTGNGA